ncbi:MAG: hypothetical protein EXS49_01695 [Candidatus Pacebacteria bacterium]|nr:hypothetical protein [Candidatus Paceibacterota bacterium]
MKEFWFKNKKYGYGWAPANWKGWLVLIFWLGLNVWFFSKIDKNSHSVSDTLIGFFPAFVTSTIFLIGICIVKGEKPRWRWGDNDESVK